MKKFKVIEPSRFHKKDELNFIKGGIACTPGGRPSFGSCHPAENYTFDYICANNHVTCTNGSYSICTGVSTKSTCTNTYSGPVNPFTDHFVS